MFKFGDTMQLSKSSITDVLANVKHADTFLEKIGVVTTDKQKTLSDALAEKNIDVNAAIATLNLLNRVEERDIHWLMEPTANLINHIKNRYHNHHRLQLPMLVALAEEVELNNQQNPYCPVGLAGYLNELHNDLLMHMENEEKILFPFLAENKNFCVFSQVSLAMHNHDHDMYVMGKIDEITNKFLLPEDAGETWKLLYVELKKFKDDLMEHIRLENEILFEKCN